MAADEEKVNGAATPGARLRKRVHFPPDEFLEHEGRPLELGITEERESFAYDAWIVRRGEEMPSVTKDAARLVQPLELVAGIEEAMKAVSSLVERRASENSKLLAWSRETLAGKRIMLTDRKLYNGSAGPPAWLAICGRHESRAVVDDEGVYRGQVTLLILHHNAEGPDRLGRFDYTEHELSMVEGYPVAFFDDLDEEQQEIVVLFYACLAAFYGKVPKMLG